MLADVSSRSSNQPSHVSSRVQELGGLCCPCKRAVHRTAAASSRDDVLGGPTPPAALLTAVGAQHKFGCEFRYRKKEIFFLVMSISTPFSVTSSINSGTEDRRGRLKGWRCVSVPPEEI